MNAKNSLDKLSKKDVYSLLLFVLFKCRDIPELATISKLVYLLDEENFLKLIKYFSGQTITIPTIEDIRKLIYLLIMYQEVEINKSDIAESINSIPEELRSSVLDNYDLIVSIMKEYSFV